MQAESPANPSPVVMLMYQSTAQQRTQARMRGTTASRDKLLRARNRKTIGLVSLSFTMAWPWQIPRSLHGCSVVSRGVRFWPIGLAQISWTPWRGVNEIGRSETFVANKSDGVYPVRYRLSQIVTQQSAFRCNMRAGISACDRSGVHDPTNELCRERAGSCHSAPPGRGARCCACDLR